MITQSTYEGIIKNLVSYIKFVKIVGLTFDTKTKNFTYNNTTYTPIEIVDYILENSDNIDIYIPYFLNDCSKTYYNVKIDHFRLRTFEHHKHLLSTCK